MNNEHFLLYRCCVPVKGKTESIIMDLQRGTFIKIPNLLYDILEQNLYNIDIKQLKSKFNNAYDQGIDKYFNYFIQEELGFFTEEPELFPKISLTFKNKFKVISSVICINKDSKYSLLNVLNQLDRLSCQIIQIRVFNFFSIKKLNEILNQFNESRIRLFEIFLEDFDYELESLINLMRVNLRVKVVVHSSKLDKSIKIFENKNLQKLVFTSKTISITSKEVYKLELFTCNTTFFTEAINFNIGLNRKVCIDSRGKIKNYLSHKKDYGNISNTKLIDVIENSDFKKVWYITNDKIEKCRECQYRYMCISNSEVNYIKGKYYKSNSCDFNFN